ncbi:MAG: hypothetical protein MZV64_09265 [Ignavibacteriales bacterium]|nr:hypothetical protein [Ignavibacteriales bacterium]
MEVPRIRNPPGCAAPPGSGPRRARPPRRPQDPRRRRLPPGAGARPGPGLPRGRRVHRKGSAVRRGRWTPLGGPVQPGRPPAPSRRSVSGNPGAPGPPPPQRTGRPRAGPPGASAPGNPPSRGPGSPGARAVPDPEIPAEPYRPRGSDRPPARTRRPERQGLPFLQLGQTGAEVLGIRGLDPQGQTRCGMRQLDGGRVKSRPGQEGALLEGIPPPIPLDRRKEQGLAVPVQGVAGDGKAQGGQVDPDLVRPARLRAGLHQGEVPEGRYDPENRPGGFAPVGVHDRAVQGVPVRG